MPSKRNRSRERARRLSRTFAMRSTPLAAAGADEGTAMGPGMMADTSSATAPPTAPAPDEPLESAPATAVAVGEAAEDLLDGLPAEVRGEVEEASDRIRERLLRTAEELMFVGKDLLKLRDRLAPGTFVAWVEREFGITERMAQHLMNVARRFGDRAEKLSGLKRTVLYMLAAPSTPDDVVAALVARHEAGEAVQVKDVETLKREVEDARRQLEAEREMAAQQNAALTAATTQLRELERERAALLARLDELSARGAVEVGSAEAPGGTSAPYETTHDAVAEIKRQLTALEAQQQQIQVEIEQTAAHFERLAKEEHDRVERIKRARGFLDDVKCLRGKGDEILRALANEPDLAPLKVELPTFLHEVTTLIDYARKIIAVLEPQFAPTIDVSVEVPRP